MSENNIKTVKEYVKYELVEKKSVFIGHIFPVDSAQEAEKKISEISKNNPEARHNVYAYVTGNSEKMSDDGEPQGTGGAPVMSVIKLNGLSNVCIVVTRYFGGILLGAKGLVRAYSSAASGALNNSEIVKLTRFYPAVDCCLIFAVSKLISDTGQRIGISHVLECPARLLLFFESFSRKFSELMDENESKRQYG